MNSNKAKKNAQAFSQTFRRFKSHLKKAKEILVSTHLLPDGDGLGAEAALFHYLKRAKKTCQVLNPDPLPKRYRFLDSAGTILLGPEGPENEDPSKPSWDIPWDKFDLWIILDTNDPRRLGKLWNELSIRAKTIVFLDHHVDISEVPELSYPPNALLVADPRLSSIGELLYQLFNDLKLTKINHDIALGLYVSVMTDTNSFRYARTTPLAHRIAADMIQLGVNPEEVYQAIYSSKEVSHVQLLGKMLQDVRVEAQGKIAWLQMDLDLRRRHLASADDTQSFLNLLLLIKNAEIVCFFREEDNGTIRVSMKSKGRIMISQMAMELGGGGHDYAAGLASSFPMEKTIQTVINRLVSLVESQ